MKNIPEQLIKNNAQKFQNQKKAKQNDTKKANKMQIFRARVNRQMTKHK